MNAYSNLRDYLEKGEKVEAVVFGEWGWGDYPAEPGCEEDWDGNTIVDNPPVPRNKRGIILPIKEARKYMAGWEFDGGYGSPECYATYIWTNQRVIWVTQYDGATRLDSAPRNPIDIIPDMPGG